MDATCDIQEEKKGREKPQVMHIRLRICHIFLSWSVSKLVHNLACACVCVFEKQNERDSIYTFIHIKLRGAVLCCQAFSVLDMTCEFTDLLTSIAPLCCAALYCVSVCLQSHCL